MKYAVFVFLLPAVVFATSPTKTTVELYTNMSRLSYQFNENKIIHLQVPEFVGEDLQISSTCKVLKSKLGKAADLPNKNFSLLSKQVDEIKRKIEANRAKRKLLESYSLKQTPLKQLEKSLGIFEDNYLEMLSAEQNMNKKAQELVQELQKIQMEQSYKKVKNFDIFLECTKNSSTTISFPIVGLSYKSNAIFNANTEENSVDVVQESIIRHSLGNLLQDVDIKLYSFAYSNLMRPVYFSPNYLDVYQTRKLASMQKVASGVNMHMEKANTTYDRSFETHGKTKRFWQIKSKSLAPNEDNRIIFGKQSLHVKFKNYIDGYGSEKAYLQSKISPKESILQRRGKFEIDGVLVGEQFIEPMYKDENQTLYFGENSFIEVEKEIEKDFTKESFFGTSKVVKKAWHYKITNRSNNKEEIILTERLPISKHEDIKVKLLEKIKPHKIEKNGKVWWSFTLEAGKSKEVIFGYSVQRPVDKSVEIRKGL